MDPEANQIILAGNFNILDTRAFNIVKKFLKDYELTKVKDNKKVINSLIFTNHNTSPGELLKTYLRLKSLELFGPKAEFLTISEKQFYLLGNKGSTSLYPILDELKATFAGIEIELFDPLYCAKLYGIEAGRKILYQEFTKFANEGLDIDPRYYSLFCDLVTNKGKLLPLGRNGVLNFKPPLAKLAYEAAKSGVFELAFSNKKDYLQNPYSCLITNRPIKIGADYFEIYL